MKKFLAAVAAAALLSGCTALIYGPDPLKGSTAVYSWQATGRMVFQCEYDREGFYWKFIRPEGTLTDDAGRRQGVLQPDFGITATDGSGLHAKIIQQGPQENARDLRTAVFAAEADSRGKLAGIRFIARRQPSGGMPLASCTASQRGHYLKVPFRARYIFYR
ncbi:DUF3455 domain-containing protein [Sutterella sp.]|uniref:DUF3455 domain-containing protein n=1 Tax=Sutterella sp. TaxID=1981025 RepID=UPI0026DF77DB|nr:DUF3455 domain-containing protein [Sutterella sp.]MDO5530483.1 DUF3455 domain-containing protein [Sutterella sp.]